MNYEPENEGLRAIADRVRERLADPVGVAKAAQIAERSEAYERERVSKLRAVQLEASGIPRALWGLLEEPRMTAPVAAVEAFLEADGPKSSICVLSGKKDTGKTVGASVGVFRRGGIFITAVELSQMKFEGSNLSRLKRVGCLAIDELGMEGKDQSGWLAGPFFDLIDRRCGGGLKTVITTNLDGDVFVARYMSGDLERLNRRFQTYGRFVKIEPEMPAPPPPPLPPPGQQLEVADVLARARAVAERTGP